MVAQPQDRKPSIQEMLHNALQLQGANFAMKAQLDMMATKIILVLKETNVALTVADSALTATSAAEQYDMHLREIKRLLSMTRDETAQARKGFEYEEPRVQAIINEAAQKLADLLLENGQR